jgi:protoheme IX farnesyltransferase
LRRVAASAEVSVEGPAGSNVIAKPGTPSALQRWLASRTPLYWKLAKGKLTVWVALSAIPGYLVAVPGAIDPSCLAALACGTLLTSSSAQTMNQIYEVNRDALMSRTAQRPLPSGRITVAEASAFAIGSGSLGLGILAAGATPATAMVSGLTIFTYVGLYTPMKVLSCYNTHVGAISGSLPTLLGFTAALGTGIVASPWAGHAIWLFAMQTLWQMPHFYALAWIHRADYIKGGYRMFPLSDATGHATAAMCKPYLVAMCAMPWAASAAGLASWMLPIGAAVPSALWWRSLRKFEEKPNAATCRRFFLGSLSYLLATLALFTAYAHTKQPASTKSSEGKECQDAAVEDAETLKAVHVSGPAWRTSFCELFSDFCPHEQIRSYLMGILNSNCPLSVLRKAMS